MRCHDLETDEVFNSLGKGIPALSKGFPGASREGPADTEPTLRVVPTCIDQPSGTILAPSTKVSRDMAPNCLMSETEGIKLGLLTVTLRHTGCSSQLFMCCERSVMELQPQTVGTLF